MKPKPIKTRELAVGSQFVRAEISGGTIRIKVWLDKNVARPKDVPFYKGSSFQEGDNEIKIYSTSPSLSREEIGKKFTHMNMPIVWLN